MHRLCNRGIPSLPPLILPLPISNSLFALSRIGPRSTAGPQSSRELRRLVMSAQHVLPRAATTAPRRDHFFTLSRLLSRTFFYLLFTFSVIRRQALRSGNLGNKGMWKHRWGLEKSLMKGRRERSSLRGRAVFLA